MQNSGQRSFTALCVPALALVGWGIQGYRTADDMPTSASDYGAIPRLRRARCEQLHATQRPWQHGRPLRRDPRLLRQRTRGDARMRLGRTARVALIRPRTLDQLQDRGRPPAVSARL